MFAKIFQQIYDGTLSEDWQALVTFQQLLILSDHEGYIDMTPQAIHRVTSIPLEIISHGISKLLMPDPQSRTDLHDGRRIIPIDADRNWGWIVVNKKKYRDLANYEEKKERERIRISEKRIKSNMLPSVDNVDNVAKCCDVLPGVANVAYTDTYTDKDKDSNNNMVKGTVLEPKKDSGCVSGRLSLTPLALLWNEVCGPELGMVVKITKTRKGKEAKRLKEHSIEDFKTAFKKILQSDFLTGKSPPREKGQKPFKPGYDWYIENDTNIVKVLEGKYDNADDRTRPEQLIN